MNDAVAIDPPSIHWVGAASKIQQPHTIEGKTMDTPQAHFTIPSIAVTKDTLTEEALQLVYSVPYV